MAEASARATKGTGERSAGQLEPTRGRRRALLQGALTAAAGTFAGATLAGGRASADTGFLKYGAVNDAVGSTTILKSAFGNGTNFTVETKTGGNVGDAVAVRGEVLGNGTNANGGNVYGVRGFASVPGVHNSIGVDGWANPGLTTIGVRGFGNGGGGIGVRGEGGAVGVQARLYIIADDVRAVDADAYDGFGVHTTSYRGTALYARSEVGEGIRAESGTGPALHAESDAANDATIEARHLGGGFSLRSHDRTDLRGETRFGGRAYADGPGARFEGNGSGLTGLNANGISTGTLADARLSPRVPLKDATSNVFSGSLSAKSLGGGGAGISNLNAANIATGTLADARLSANIPRHNASATPFAGNVSAARFTGAGGAPPSFAGVGTAVVAAGKQTGVVRTPGVDANGHVLALFQSNPGAGVWVAHIAKIPGGFRAVLNARAKRTATLAFFVVRQA
jgi:hypothetical protein